MFKRKKDPVTIQQLRQFAIKKFNERNIPGVTTTDGRNIKGPEFQEIQNVLKGSELAVHAKQLILNQDRYEFCKTISDPNSPYMKKHPEIVQHIMGFMLNTELDQRNEFKTGMRS